MFKINQIINDTSIYQFRPDLNAGADPILELIKNASGQIIPSQTNPLEEWPESTTSRLLLKSNDIQWESGSKHCLLLHLTESTNLVGQFIDIEIAPITVNWKEGVGNRNDFPYVKSGATWDTLDGTTIWPEPFWNDSEKITYTLDLEKTDFEVDITSLVQYWASNTNNGFIIKFTDSFEEISYDHSNLKFFGRDTHTIWNPSIVSYYSETTYAGPFNPTSIIPAHLIDVSIRHFKNEFNYGESIYYNLSVRKLYNSKVYTNSLTTIEQISLPETQFQIEDSITGKVVIPYNTLNQVLKSDDGYYISFNTDKFIKNRYYRIKFKIISSDGNIYIKDHNYNFKIS